MLEEGSGAEPEALGRCDKNQVCNMVYSQIFDKKILTGC